MTADERLDRLEAKLYVQAAEAIALRYLLSCVYKIVGETEEQKQICDSLFSRLRNKSLRNILEKLETREPAKAARILAILQEPSLNFPVDYDDLC